MRQVLEQIDVPFFHRVYRTTLVVLVISAIFVWGRFGVAAALGWLAGSLISLGVLVSVEWSVRQYLESSGKAVGKVSLLYFGKVAVVLLLLLAAFYLRRHGLMSLRWLMFGFPFPGLIVMLKLMGLVLRAYQLEEQHATRNQRNPP